MCNKKTVKNGKKHYFQQNTVRSEKKFTQKKIFYMDNIRASVTNCKPDSITTNNPPNYDPPLYIVVTSEPKMGF